MSKWKGFKQLPSCSGYKYWTACGYEYDCEAVHDKSCEKCLCTFHETGGIWNPETGKKENYCMAVIKYGKE